MNVENNKEKIMDNITFKKANKLIYNLNFFVIN